jgi:hypothetical protein
MNEWNFEDYYKRYYLITNCDFVESYFKKIQTQKESDYIEKATYEEKLLKMPLSQDYWIIYNKSKKKKILKISTFKGGKFFEREYCPEKEVKKPKIIISYKREGYKSYKGIVNILSKIKLYSYEEDKKILIKSLTKDKILEICSPNIKIGKVIKNDLRRILSIEAIAFNEYMLFLTKKFIKKDSHFINEFPGEEIELKFENVDELIHKKLYCLFQNKVKNFKTEKNFPFFLYRNLVVGYLSKDTKIILGYKDKPLKVKKIDVAVYDKNNYKIIRRKELKKESSVEVFNKIPEKNILIKRKRVFWIENMKTNRIYHIAIDKEMGKKNSMSQIEIEYAGIISRKKEKDMEAIKKDLIEIAEIIKNRFKKLEVTTRTKGQWLRKTK